MHDESIARLESIEAQKRDALPAIPGSNCHYGCNMTKNNKKIVKRIGIFFDSSISANNQDARVEVSPPFNAKLCKIRG